MEDGSIPEKKGKVTLEGVHFYAVPEGCISAIIAFTTPSDACRFALVSKLFLSASESDINWEKFLPSDYDLIVAGSDAGEEAFADCHNKKQIYLRLANTPLLTDDGTKSFSLDKLSGNKCWMIGARNLCIEHIDSPLCWQWTFIPESRFPEIVQLVNEERVYIRCKIHTSTLTPGTTYAAYFVYKRTANAKGLNTVCKASVSPPHGKAEMRLVYLTVIGALRLSSIADKLDQGPKTRTDGWQEVKIGEFFTHVGEEGRAWLYVDMKDGGRITGLLVQGIEVRPEIPNVTRYTIRSSARSLALFLVRPERAALSLFRKSTPRPTIPVKVPWRHFTPPVTLKALLSIYVFQILGLTINSWKEFYTVQ